MLKQKSKILNLQKKQKVLRVWNRHAMWLLCANSFLSIIFVGLGSLLGFSPVLIILAAIDFAASMIALTAHSLTGEKMVQNKIADIDQEVLHLVKTDAEELAILREHDKLQMIDREIEKKQEEKKEQKRLIKQMIETRNREASQQQGLIKLLTKENKKSAKARAIKEVEALSETDFNFDLI